MSCRVGYKPVEGIQVRTDAWNPQRDTTATKTELENKVIYKPKWSWASEGETSPKLPTAAVNGTHWSVWISSTVLEFHSTHIVQGTLWQDFYTKLVTCQWDPCVPGRNNCKPLWWSLPLWDPPKDRLPIPNDMTQMKWSIRSESQETQQMMQPEPGYQSWRETAK